MEPEALIRALLVQSPKALAWFEALLEAASKNPPTTT